MRLKDIIERIKLPFRKEKELYSCFYKILGFYPNNIHYYKQAIHHKSSPYKKDGSYINNERLEFLGDAILDAVISDIIFRKFKGKREGFLTNTRSKIVQRETLNKLATDIKLDKLIISSTRSHFHNNYIYGNAFEALIGAIYLDKGYSYCMLFIRSRIIGCFINIDKMAYKEVNFKSKLLEWGQKRHVEITFNLIEEGKEENNNTPVFTTQICIGNITGCTGKGYSKKESQQIAAQKTLNLIKTSPELISSILTENKTEEEIVPEKENPLQ